MQASGGGTDFAIGTGTLVVNSLTSITPSFTASNKTYNGNDSATVSFTGFSPSVGADAVTVSYTSATFSNANAGTGKTVTIAGLSLSGADAYKYTLSSTTATTTANIAQADANVTINPYSGTYDAAAHNLTGTVVGVAGDLAATGSSLTFGASFTNVPGGTGTGPSRAAPTTWTRAAPRRSPSPRRTPTSRSLRTAAPMTRRRTT